MLRVVSVDMAVWEGERPASNEDAAQTFEALYEQYVEREPTVPTPKVREFVESLLARFPDFDDLSDDEMDDSPWADSPLIGNASGPFFYFSMVTNSAAAEAWDLATRTAARMGLVAFDPQEAALA
jgi:hypothetical protein